MTREFIRAIGDASIDLRHYDLDLSVARTKERISLAGTFLYAPNIAFDDSDTVSSSLVTGECIVRFGKQNGTPTYFVAGQVHNRDPFDEVFITNAAQSGKMLRLYYGVGNAIEPYVSSAGVIFIGGDTFDSKDDVTLTAGARTQIIAASRRKEVSISNIGSATVRIGDITCTATNGIPLASGATLFLETSGAVYGWNPDAAAVDVAVSEIAP